MYRDFEGTKTTKFLSFFVTFHLKVAARINLKTFEKADFLFYPDAVLQT